MASIQSSSFLSRTRSGRVPAAAAGSTRPLSKTAPIAEGHSSASAPPATAASSPVSVSNVSLFLTNLRLLDLDLLPDCPDIGSLTFSGKEAAQGQKKRVQCVEWALYRLFELWDEDETRNKLQPFFPPLDQVQSLNLRAALLRCLDQAKKAGVLGRDAVVRKTMLDECKGERLEEVLAVFSSAVLKKLVAEAQLNSRGRGPAARQTAAQALALENRGYSGDTSELVAMVLAHRVSLSRLLEEKNLARGRYKDLAQLLDLKERGIARRREQLREADAPAAGRAPENDLSDDEKMALWRAVRNNWSGNERWMEALLFGDAQAQRDGVLTAPFDRVWRRVQSGRLSELESQGGDGLLAQLDGRVKTQRDRLEKWQQFRRDMFGSDTSRQDREQKRKSLGGRPTSFHKRGIDLGFGPHENLHFGRTSPQKLLSRPAALKPEYAAIMDGLEGELSQINKGSANPFVGGFRSPFAHLKRSNDSLQVDGHEEPVSELSESEDDIPRGAPLHQSSVPTSAASRDSMSSATTTQPLERKHSIRRDDEQPVLSRPARGIPKRPAGGLGSRPRSLRLDRSTTLPPAKSVANEPKSASVLSQRSLERTPDRSPVVSPTTAAPQTPSPVRSPPGRARQEEQRRRQYTAEPVHREVMPPPPPPPAVSETQQMADEILASMNVTSPSPQKLRRTLSLADRTRLSMAPRGSHVGTLGEGDDEPESLRLRRYNSTTTPNRRRAQTSSSALAGGNGKYTNMPEEPQTPAEVEGDEDDLVARTRRSMANFEATRQKVQLERQRSQRKAARQSNVHQPTPQQVRRHGASLMPSFMEEEGGEGESMLAEEMIQNGVDDYEAVFMSRPKIKTSPAVTPTPREWNE